MKNIILKYGIAGGLSFAAFLLVVLGWMLAYYSLKGIGQPLILHYDSSYAGAGINQIGAPRDLAFMGVTGIVVVALDTLLALTLDKRHPLWGKMTAAAALFFAGLLFAGFMAIIAVNS